MNVLESELRYFATFRNAKAKTEGESADLPYFNPKICCYGNVPCAIGKRGSDW